MEITDSHKQSDVELGQELKGHHTIFRKGDKFVGLVSQNPDHPHVMNPGSWSASIHTKDEGLWNFGPFETREEATKAGEEGLGCNWTFDQWVQAETESK